MKFLKSSLVALALMASMACAIAQSGTGFSGVGVTNALATAPNNASNLQFYVIAPQQSAPVVTYVQASLAGGDISNAIVQVRFRFPVTEASTIQPTSSGILGTNAMTVGSTNGLTTSDVYVFQKGNGGPWQRLTPASFGTGLITFNETLLTTITTSDKLFRMDLRGRLAGGNGLFPVTTYRERIEAGGSGPVFVGRAGVPAMVEVVATNFPTLNLVSGRYGFWQP